MPTLAASASRRLRWRPMGGSWSATWARQASSFSSSSGGDGDGDNNDESSPTKGNLQDHRLRSHELTGVEATADWQKRAGARAFLWAAGWQAEDFRKPIITVACPWTNATPCNNHFREPFRALPSSQTTADRDSDIP